jgi:hypothetical protein
MRPSFSLFALSFSLLGACAPAQMRLPDTFAASSRTEFTGFTGWNHGRFTAGPYTGDYERSADRLAFVDTFRTSSARAEFTIAGPQVDSTIEARCRMREHSIDAGVVEVVTRPMIYGCDFTAEGRPFPARFELQEAHGDVLRPYERRGEIALGGETVQIRSVHRIEGTSLATLAPIGYLFEQQGRPVGAVELNGKPVLILPAGTEPALVRTLTVAALALGVLHDPANDADS